MTTVSTSYAVQYGVRTTVSSSGTLVQYGVRTTMSKPTDLQYKLKQMVYPSKLVAINYGVRSTVSTSGMIILYGVRVPVAAPPSVSLAYGVRASVPKSYSIVYNTAIPGTTTVSTALDIRYATMVTSTQDQIIVTTTPPDPVPPQIVTTRAW